MGSVCCKTSKVESVSLHNFQNNSTEGRTEVSELNSSGTLSSSPQRILWKRGECIGSGSNFNVYQCLNINTGEILAVKTFRLRRETSGKFSEMIKREIKLMGGISHPNILTCCQTEVHENRIEVLYEYIPAGSLKELSVEFGIFDERIIRNYTKQILRGLCYLHRNSIFHNNINPKTILVTETGQIKLTNFGMSTKGQDQVDLKQLLQKDPYWSAPEVLNEQTKTLDSSLKYCADIWSLGCVLVELLSGKNVWFPLKPFEVLRTLCSSQKVPRIPECSPSLVNFIELCLQREPSSRPSADKLSKHVFITGRNYSYDFQLSETMSDTLKDSLNSSKGLNSKKPDSLQGIIQEISSIESEN